MGRDHKLYYEAYNDHSDLDDDLELDTGFRPAKITYFGYFDSFKCYTYDSGAGQFNPTARTTTDKTCDGTKWSGDWLNYVTMSRMDALAQSAVRRLALHAIRRAPRSWSARTSRRTRIAGASPTRARASTATTSTSTRRSASRKRTRATSSRTRRRSARHRPRLFTALNKQYGDGTPLKIWHWLSIERPVAGADAVTGISATGSEVRTSLGTHRREDRAREGLRRRGRPGSQLPRLSRRRDRHLQAGRACCRSTARTTSMKFGLLSGSYAKNLDGGVLRKAVGSITDEISQTTGIFTRRRRHHQDAEQPEAHRLRQQLRVHGQRQLRLGRRRPDQRRQVPDVGQPHRRDDVRRPALLRRQSRARRRTTRRPPARAKRPAWVCPWSRGQQHEPVSRRRRQPELREAVRDRDQRHQSFVRHGQGAGLRIQQLHGRPHSGARCVRPRPDRSGTPSTAPARARTSSSASPEPCRSRSEGQRADGRRPLRASATSAASRRKNRRSSAATIPPASRTTAARHDLNAATGAQKLQHLRRGARLAAAAHRHSGERQAHHAGAVREVRERRAASAPAATASSRPTRSSTSTSTRSRTRTASSASTSKTSSRARTTTWTRSWCTNTRCTTASSTSR